MNYPIKQDLHIHTTYSPGDSAVEPQQTLDLIKEVSHSEIIGISDHFELIPDHEIYRNDVHAHQFWCGCEINLSDHVPHALELPFDYYIFHCRDRASEYRGAEKLLESGKPVIISHPMMIGADLNKVPTGCYIEVNNRYVWKADYMTFYAPHLSRFKFVLGSDAHQPNWLNHMICRHAADKMGIKETLLFPGPYGKNQKQEN
jgi:histidinol phosphatase-like PHP family hydrolase